MINRMAKKLLLFIGLLSLFVWNVEARKQNILRLENDTILHICSNFSEMDSWTFGSISDYDSLEYFNSPYCRIKNIVIDEGVDSIHFGWLYLISAKRLSIPSSLKYLYFYSEVPPGLEEIRLGAKNPNYRWENGTLYNRDKTQLYFILPSAVDSVLQIPETVEQVWIIPDRYYPKDLSFRNWEGYPERSPEHIHYSKIVFPKHCKRYPEYLPPCDSLIILSEHCPEFLTRYVMSKFSYLYCLSDSAVAHIYMLWNLWNADYDRGKLHCPNYDVRKRDTSWMRESYRLTCVLDNGDTLVGADSIPSGREIESVKIEGIADENVKFNKRYGEDVYRFYVTTYDTLYRLPLEVFEKPEERKPGPKCGDFGEVRDSVFTIREGVDSLPYLSDRPSSFRKVIIPKSMHYVKEHITCDSVFIYSDSLDGAYYYNWLHYIDAHYYYVENEQLYLSLKRWLIKSNQSAVVYCPNADISKRDMSLQQNTNKPVWKKNAKGDELKDLTYRTVSSGTGLWLEIEGMNSQDLYVYNCRRKRFLPRNNKYGFFEFINDGRTAELEFAVWTYDTLLPLQQKDTLRLLKRDGTPWTGGYNLEECVLYYVPKGETERSLLLSDKPLKIWRSGDTIPRRYTNRLAFGYMLTNGECVLSPRLEYNVLCLDKRNYLGDGELINVSDNIWKVPSQYKKFWLEHVTEPCEDCYGRSRPPMHFYVGR